MKGHRGGFHKDTACIGTRENAERAKKIYPPGRQRGSSEETTFFCVQDHRRGYKISLPGEKERREHPRVYNQERENPPPWGGTKKIVWATREKVGTNDAEKTPEGHAPKKRAPQK